MGTVWKAQDELLPRQVAVKVVGGTRQADPIAMKRFQREAIAMANLSHPNVVSVYDVGREGDQAFMVMELLSGPSVAKLVADRGQLRIDEVVHMGSQVARGLSAAHAIGVTHRDIKPGNVVRHGRATKIVDFGIARLESTAATAASLTSPAMAIGTAAYMSPEQARGKLVQPSSDVYSLACLLTTMLTGRPPFVDPDPIEVARAHAMDVPRPVVEARPEVPRALNDLLAAMLVKRPADRPSAAQVAVALTRIETTLLGLADPGSGASPLASSDEQFTHPQRRRTSTPFASVSEPEPARPARPRTTAPFSQPTPIQPPDGAAAPARPKRRGWFRRR